MSQLKIKVLKNLILQELRKMIRKSDSYFLSLNKDTCDTQQEGESGELSYHSVSLITRWATSKAKKATFRDKISVHIKIIQSKVKKRKF